MQKQLKPKKCKSCGQMFTPFSSLSKVCSMACSLDYVGTEKQKKEQKEARKQKKDFLDNDKSFQRAKAQKNFNEFIRLRDEKLPCISCNRSPDWSGQWHAGHYKTVGARPDLRFNEDNCHKQCSICNNHLSGNLAEYFHNLESKIGHDRLSALNVELKPKKYTAQDYKEIAEHYKAKVKLLTKSMTT